jgi:hypothetical protein
MVLFEGIFVGSFNEIIFANIRYAPETPSVIL